MTYGHLQADCLYTGISSGPNARCRVWEAFTFLPLLMLYLCMLYIFIFSFLYLTVNKADYYDVIGVSNWAAEEFYWVSERVKVLCPTRHKIGHFGDVKTNVLQHKMNTNSSTVAEMGDRLATTDMGRKLGAAVQCGLGWGLPPYQVALIHPAIWLQ